MIEITPRDDAELALWAATLDLAEILAALPWLRFKGGARAPDDARPPSSFACPWRPVPDTPRPSPLLLKARAVGAAPDEARTG